MAGLPLVPLPLPHALGDDLTSLGLGELALRLFLAAIAAAAIGWERELKNRPAGLRTHMLVGVGACLFTLLAFDTFDALAERSPGMDPLRVVEGVVGGVGFLGAGAIIESRGSVKGLTTAAGIWVVAAFGVAAALGNYAALALAFVFASVILTLLARLERAVIHRRRAAAPGPDDVDDAPREP